MALAASPAAPPLVAALLAILATLGASACDEPMRVPYIKPDLARWDRPYSGIDGLVLHVFETGVLRVPETLLRQGGLPTETRSLPVVAFVLEHPREGLVVIGSGLPAEAVAVGAPGTGLLAGFLASEAQPSQTLATQMGAAGLDVAAVRWVLLPTLRAHHVGGAEDFPDATVVVSRRERQQAMRAPAVYRLDDFDVIERWRLLDPAAPGVGTFARAEDLFGDGSVLAIDAAGATAGALVFLVRLAERPVLLAAGLAETGAQARYATKPGAAQDLEAWWQHIWELKRFADLAPELVVVPGAEPGVLEALGAPSVVLHAAPPVAETTPATR